MHIWDGYPLGMRYVYIPIATLSLVCEIDPGQWLPFHNELLGLDDSRISHSHYSANDVAVLDECVIALSLIYTVSS